VQRERWFALVNPDAELVAKAFLAGTKPLEAAALLYAAQIPISVRRLPQGPSRLPGNSNYTTLQFFTQIAVG
jgi:hypothetical protein